jgi:hypothetical protein
MAETSAFYRLRKISRKCRVSLAAVFTCHPSRSRVHIALNVFQCRWQRAVAQLFGG